MKTTLALVAALAVLTTSAFAEQLAPVTYDTTSTVASRAVNEQVRREVARKVYVDQTPAWMLVNGVCNHLCAQSQNSGQ
jgi:hypothetical protein